ncbi:MAG TPA: metallophosphoesterase [Gemmatimonadaceae bacterium]|jgi:predicted MPP superfamily phosphohydrolase|nr:metallophosphoesterase [Gemmatimonadaceae bacterium]
MRLSRRQFITATSLGVAGAAYGVGSNALDVTHRTHPAGPGHVPLRVALLTDMHAPHDWVTGQRLIAAVRAFAPDLITIAGDAIDDRGNEHLVAFYGALEAPLGKFASLGNWEYQGLCDLRRLAREYDRVGVRLLINEHVTLDHRGTAVDLVGLDDERAGQPQYDLVASLPPNDSRALIMSHCPITFDTITRTARRPVTVLAGHTHGGQIAPFGVAIITPEGSGRYIHGWYRQGDHAMYVSRGLGNSGLPFRIGALPELVLLTV